jgi:hypothetical protein
MEPHSKEGHSNEAHSIEPEGAQGGQEPDGPLAAEPEFPVCWPVGTVVRLRQRPSYLKTADPMPMLRPSDLIGMDEQGQVVEQRALGQIAVRFRRGTFLLAAGACEPDSD